MKQTEAIGGYRWLDAKLDHCHAYLLPTVEKALEESGRRGAARRLFDLGCGNGSVAGYFAAKGFEVAGVDPSAEGIEQGNREFPELNLRVGSAYDDLPQTFGQFPAVVSLEVVEHVYAPRDYAKTLFNLVEPGGIAIVSTPYHGYFKNLVMAATGKLDAHFTALWDHGHIKFWSIKTLGELLREVGFSQIDFYRTGRVPVIAKSMIAVAHKSRT